MTPADILRLRRRIHQTLGDLFDARPRSDVDERLIHSLVDLDMATEGVLDALESHELQVLRLQAEVARLCDQVEGVSARFAWTSAVLPFMERSLVHTRRLDAMESAGELLSTWMRDAAGRVGLALTFLNISFDRDAAVSHRLDRLESAGELLAAWARAKPVASAKSRSPGSRDDPGRIGCTAGAGGPR